MVKNLLISNFCTRFQLRYIQTEVLENQLLELLLTKLHKIRKKMTKIYKNRLGTQVELSQI